MDKVVMLASNIQVSELKSNPMYITVSMRMFSTRENLNHNAVTEAFIDDIVTNKQDYVCMPLCADTVKLKNRDYRGLTHLYDPKSHTFLAEQIGSFYDYEKVEDEYGVSLIGYARINKRSDKISEAINELYESGCLNFSFEIYCGKLSTVNGVKIIDACEENRLMAMAIVSVPAYPESRALEMVAEVEDESIVEFYAKANYVVSEMDIETVRIKVYRAIDEVCSELIMYGRALLFTMNSIILYDPEHGKTWKCEYVINGNEDVLIKDIYEVDFIRVNKGETVRENGNPNEIGEVKAEVVVEDQAESQGSAIAEMFETPPEQEEPEHKNEDEEVKETQEQEATEGKATKESVNSSDLEAKISELERQNMALTRWNEQLRAERDQTRRDSLMEFARAEGLDLNNAAIAEAIRVLDHEKIMEAAMAYKAKQKNAQVHAAAYVGMRVDGGNDMSYLFKRS